jgi:hypothetical protein
MGANIILWWAGREVLFDTLVAICIIGLSLGIVYRILKTKTFDCINRRLAFSLLLTITFVYRYSLYDTEYYMPIIQTVFNCGLILFTVALIAEAVVTGVRNHSWEGVNFYAAHLLYAMMYIILGVFLPADMEMETISVWWLIPFMVGLAVAVYNSVYIEKHKQGAFSMMAGHVCTFIYALLVFFIIKFNFFP